MAGVIHKWKLILFFAFLSSAGHASDYYSVIHGETGIELRRALHLRIRAHVIIPYSSTAFDTSDALKILDEDPANTNNVILLYAQRSEPKTNFALTGGWNREHCWPNSYGLDDREPSYSDLVNLRAEDENVNSSRGNKYYDISDPQQPSYRFPAHIEAPLCSTDSDSWEPPPNMKGDIARALFYMDVCYEGDFTGDPELVLSENTTPINSTNAFMGRLGALLAWHYADPVSDAERLRNERIYNIQNNRNPFVDHPEWVDEVFRPRLKIKRIPGQLVPWDVEISWPVAFSNAVVELYTGSAWANFGVTPVRRGEEWIVQTLARGKAFYRVR